MSTPIRQFEFPYLGLQVFCTAHLYEDGSLCRVEINYVMEGMMDWLAYASDSKSPAIRLIRMRAARELRFAATMEVVRVISSSIDTFDFDFL